jgi:hypothetical protein
MFNGPPPTIQTFKGQNEEIAAVGDWIAECAKDGLLPHEFGVFVRSSEQLNRARAAAEAAGVAFKTLDDNVETTIDVRRAIIYPGDQAQPRHRPSRPRREIPTPLPSASCRSRAQRPRIVASWAGTSEDGNATRGAADCPPMDSSIGKQWPAATPPRFMTHPCFAPWH